MSGDSFGTQYASLYDTLYFDKDIMRRSVI